MSQFAGNVVYCFFSFVISAFVFKWFKFHVDCRVSVSQFIIRNLCFFHCYIIMNELIIPPAPLWYKSLAVACAPDGTLVYGSKNDIVVITERGPEESAEVQLIQAAHSKYVTSVSLNKKWKDPNAYAVSLGEDSVIKVWNLETLEKKLSNKDHVEHKHTVIGAVFAGDDRVVSAAADGFIIIWNINTNESKPLKDLFGGKVSLTCLSSCPHAGWLLAFGLNNGCVVVADLRRNGQVLYRLRGHYQAVVALSWCPAPVNVFPRNTQNKVKNKTVDIITNHTEQKPIHKPNREKTNPWVNLVHADDNEIPQEQPGSLTLSTVDDFLKECNKLKSKIMGIDEAASVSASEKERSQLGESSVENNHGQDTSNEYKPSEHEDSKLQDLLNKSDHNVESSDKADEYKEISEEQDVEETRHIMLNNSRPLPRLFDPSGDFLDDCVFESDPVNEEIVEDKDIGDEKEKSEYNVTKEKEEDNKKSKISRDECSGIVTDESADMTAEAEEEPRTEYLLASSGKDRHVYIWRAGTDGRLQTFFQTPKRTKHKEGKPSNVWITLCWITPDTILTSSMIGEVLAWPLPKPKESSKQYRVIHSEHSSVIFNIVTTPLYMSPYNWRDKVDKTVWTWSHDGKLINYHLNSEKIRFSWCTVTASITCFDSSPLDPNRLAIGVRDGSIRVWDLSLPHTKIIPMHKFQQKVTYRVSAIAWNPLKEVILGFGTEEGRVGFIDTVSKKSTLFPHYFHNQVYKVEWGPIQGNTSNLGLYVVAEGKVAIYDMQKPNEDPIQLELPEQLYVYKFSWKPDFSLLLLNGKDGSLVILKTDLVAITTIYLNEKGLNGIVWHPDAFTSKPDISLRCNWFAATTSKGLLVYDCSAVIENTSVKENLMENIIVLFEGHLKPTLSLAWCPFDGNKIVSTAADGLAHVWDVVAKVAVSTFVDPYICHNPAVIWSPVDSDLIIIGGEKVIRVWSVTKNPPKVDEEFMTARKRFLAKTAKPELDKTDKNKIKIDIPQTKTYSKNCIVPSFYVSNDDNIAAQIANMRKVMMKKEDETVDESFNNELDPLQLFSEKEEISRLLTANYEQQKKEGKHKSCELISLWKGNIGEHIKDAINENRVTPTCIMLAPMVSVRLWQDACETYARKLLESAESNPLETATYFLACHKIEEAINCLCEGALFKEALALAKQRLPENSDVIITITQKWAEQCIANGNFETAAFCYISIRQYVNAAKVLARRCNKEFLEFAAELAEKEGNKSLYDSIKFKCNELNAEKSSSGDKTDQAESLSLKVDVALDKLDDTEKSDVHSEFDDEGKNEDVEKIPSLSADQKDDDTSVTASDK